MNKPNNNLTKTNSNKIGNTKTTTITTNTKPTLNTKNTTTNTKNTTTNTKNTTTNTTNTKNTTSNNTTSSGSSGTRVIGIIILIFVIFAILGASYWLYNYYTTKTFKTSVDAELIPNIKDATAGETILESSTIPSSSFSNEYSISCWVNIQDFNYRYGDEKVILRRGDKEAGNPEIVLDKKHNNLIVRVKLQGSTVKVAKFQDIPIQIKSQNIGTGFNIPESVNYDENNNRDINETNDTNDTNQTPNKIGELLNNMPESFKKIGSNNIDYPTIHYTFDNNNTANSGISQCGYFDLISGNTVNTVPNTVIKNGNKLVEGFATTDDAVNATVAIVVDMCNIAKTIQDQQFADDSVESMNNAFQYMIELLEASRNTAKSGADVNSAVAALSSDISMPTQKSDTVLSQQLETLMTDMKTLSTMSDVQIDYTNVITAINSKMSSISCPLTIDSTTEIDGTISFYENIINLIKKTIFMYINNMGSGIKKIYPELEGIQTASCLVDNDINKDPTVGICTVKMIPLQKWVNIIISVYNQVIDIYIDGQLSSSCVLKGFPSISTSDDRVTPDGGFSGKISRVLFSNTAMTVTHAKEIYYSGPIATESLFSMIPNWVYWTILVIIIIAIGYSFLM
jgi:hypothetical protein